MLDKGAGPEGCWPFTGMRDRRGYGRLAVKGPSGWVPRLAHRVAYELAHGTIPDETMICHHCDNPSCCNESHLFVGEHADNMADAVAKHRMPGGTARGESNGRAVLTDAQVAEVRSLCADGMTQRVVAARFGITQAAVSSIVRRRTR